MTGTDREVLELYGATDGWVRVDPPEDDAAFVSAVKIAGASLELSNASSSLEIECDDWAIEGEYAPTLLIEAPVWYDRKQDTAADRSEGER